MNINVEIFGQSIIAALDADLIDLDDAEELVDACYVAASNLCESSNVDVTSISLSEGTSRYRSDISKEMKIGAYQNKNIGLEQKNQCHINYSECSRVLGDILISIQYSI